MKLFFRAAAPHRRAAARFRYRTAAPHAAAPPRSSARPSSAPTQQRPAQQRPAQQRPAQQRPAQQRPAQQRPAQQRPAQQHPAQQRPAQQHPAQRSASQWTDDTARPRRSAPDDRRRVQQPAPAPAGKHGRKAKKAKKPKKKKEPRPPAADPVSRAGHPRRPVPDGGLFRHSVHRQVAHGLYPDGHEHAQPPVAGHGVHPAQRHRQGHCRNGGGQGGADRCQQRVGRGRDRVPQPHAHGYQGHEQGRDCVL